MALEETPPADYDDGNVEELEEDPNQDIPEVAEINSAELYSSALMAMRNYSTEVQADSADDLADYRYPNGDLIDIHETPPSQNLQS